MNGFLAAALTLALGLLLGYLVRSFLFERQGNALVEERKRMLLEAQQEAKKLVEQAERELKVVERELKDKEQEQRKDLAKQEERLLKKEEQLDQKIEQAEQRREQMEKQANELKERKQKAEALLSERQEELAKIAGFSAEEAKEVLFKKVEEEYAGDLVEHIKKIEADVKEQSKERAQKIIAEALQKYAAETASESTSTLVQLPSDDMKGRIIGREGRNITTFEHLAGVDVIVDDTPQTVIISGFDLVRRYIAKVALERLVSDGRIHPARIEEVLTRVKEEVGVMIKELGEKAAYDVGIVGLPPELVKLLGRLKFRVCNGQNVLKHSIEVAFIAAQIAAELGADVNVCKKAAILHDIGKAVDHEVIGHHAHIGADIAKKFGMPDKIVDAIRAHHEDPEPKSVESLIVFAANQIANNRPGAQVDNLDNFIRRMEDLENIAQGFTGVKRAYALHTGSLVQVIVDPEELNDLEAVKLSHQIARKIESDLQYQGQVKVEVLREKRVEAVAG